MQSNQSIVTCESCGFFVPHYVRIHRKFTLCGVGHCTYARGKQRKPEAPCCPHYQSRT